PLLLRPLQQPRCRLVRVGDVGLGGGGGGLAAGGVVGVAEVAEVVAVVEGTVVQMKGPGLMLWCQQQQQQQQPHQ
ncbi:hypothetical protein CLOP_g1813, partial [Closterium sp. NIES-67]